MRKKHWVMAVVALACVGLAAWAAVAAAAPKGKAATKVTLQLKWVTQAQFAGYYAALEKGYYKQQGLDVTIKVGGPSITPETVVAGKRAEFGLDWLPNLYATREKGSKLISIAQVFARSGMPYTASPSPDRSRGRVGSSGSRRSVARRSRFAAAERSVRWRARTPEVPRWDAARRVSSGAAEPSSAR